MDHPGDQDIGSWAGRAGVLLVALLMSTACYCEKANGLQDDIIDLADPAGAGMLPLTAPLLLEHDWYLAGMHNPMEYGVWGGAATIALLEHLPWHC